MAFSLNHLFQSAPYEFLQRNVLFMDALSTAQMRNKIAHCIDLEGSGRHARARVLAGLHLYHQDAPLVSYFVAPGTVAQIPREDPPYRFVFFPDFTRCRLLVSADGPSFLRLEVEENLAGSVPPAEANPGSKFLDSFAYWDYASGHLIGVIRGTALLFKQPGEPWTMALQQIVGNPGHELVRQCVMRPLKV
jgi:hypothetical protein